MSSPTLGYRVIDNELIGVGDSVTTEFPLCVAGTPVRNVVTDPAPVIYHEDWQGRVALSSEPRTNILLYASDLSRWKLRQGCTVTPGASAPDGSNNAYTLHYDGSGVPGSYRTYSSANISVDGQPYSASVWLRAAVPTTVGIYGNVAAGMYLTCALTPEWTQYRIAGTGNGTADVQLLIYSAASSNDPFGIEVFAAQIEASTVLGAYIPTPGAPVTVTDYTLSSTQSVILPVPLAKGAKLYWSGKVYYEQRASLLPPNATYGTQSTEAATARVGSLDTPLRALWNPYTCPIDILPWLAWALSIDAWKSYWPETVKRERVAQAITIQRHKGSVKSVYDVVRSFGADILLTEWWQQNPPATPHTFDLAVVVSDSGTAPTTADFVDDVINAVSRTKPVRSHFTFTQGVNAGGGVGVFACARAVHYIRIRAEAS